MTKRRPPPLEAHPLANLFPLIEGEEFDTLVASIKRNGLREKIWLARGKFSTAATVIAPAKPQESSRSFKNTPAMTRSAS